MSNSLQTRMCRNCGELFTYDPESDPREAQLYCSPKCHNEAASLVIGHNHKCFPQPIQVVVEVKDGEVVSVWSDRPDDVVVVINDRVEVGRMLAKRAAQITAAGQCAICHQPLPPLCRECEAEELNRARDHRDELIHYHTVSVGRG